MEFYTYIDYRKCLNFLMEREKTKGVDCNFSKLAEFIRVQRPYLSKIMSGTADLSEDQLYLVCDFFAVSSEERAYLELLLQYSKSGLKIRKDQIKKSILETQATKRELKNNVEAQQIHPESLLFADYFLNPYMQIVHVALNIRRFQNIEKLASILNLPGEQLKIILSKLEQLELIEFKKNRYEVTKQSIHLPKDSSLMRPHQNLLRVLSVQRQQRQGLDGSNYAFSATFSCDEEGRKKIQEDFLKYLKNIQKTVQSAGTEEVYQVNFDIFSWTK